MLIYQPSIYPPTSRYRSWGRVPVLFLPVNRMSQQKLRIRRRSTNRPGGRRCLCMSQKQRINRGPCLHPDLCHTRENHLNKSSYILLFIWYCNTFPLFLYDRYSLFIKGKSRPSHSQHISRIFSNLYHIISHTTQE